MKSIAVFNTEPVEGTYRPLLEKGFGDHTKEWAKDVKVEIVSMMPGVIYMDTYSVDEVGMPVISRGIEKEYKVIEEREQAKRWYDFIVAKFRSPKPVYMKFKLVDSDITFYVRTVD